MKQVALLFVLGFSLMMGISSTYAAQSKKISIATLPFPPISDAQLPGFGFIGELFKAIFEPLGYKVNIHMYPWARGFALSQEGREIDGIFPGIYNKEREAWFTFPDPIISSGYVLITRKDTGITRYNTLHEFKEMTIGTLRKGATGSIIDTADFKKEEGTDFAMNIRKLLGNRFDLITGEYMSITNVINTEFANRKAELVIIEPPISSIDFYLMVSLRSPNAAAILTDCNRGLAAIKSNGTLDRLKQKYGIR